MCGNTNAVFQMRIGTQQQHGVAYTHKTKIQRAAKKIDITDIQRCEIDIRNFMRAYQYNARLGVCVCGRLQVILCWAL